MKKKTTLILIPILVVLLFFILFIACSPKTVDWNGKTEYFANLVMADNMELDNYAYVGAMDYVWVGTVEKVISNVLTDNSHEGNYSHYRIRTVQNIKGSLVDEVEASKLGGFSKDGTMLLIESDYRQDIGLPEEGKTYIFMAYGQPDGSLTLSEFFDNRESTDEIIKEYEGYVANEKMNERKRFQSKYDTTYLSKTTN